MFCFFLLYYLHRNKWKKYPDDEGEAKILSYKEMNNNFISMPSVLQQEVKMKLESLMLFGYHFSYYNAMAMCTYVLLLLPCICVCLFRDYLLPPLGVCILYSATNFYQIPTSILSVPFFLPYHKTTTGQRSFSVFAFMCG